MNRRDFLKGILTYTAATALGSMAAQLGGPAVEPKPRGWVWPRPPGHVVIGWDPASGPNQEATALYQSGDGTWTVLKDRPTLQRIDEVRTIMKVGR